MAQKPAPRSLTQVYTDPNFGGLYTADGRPVGGDEPDGASPLMQSGSAVSTAEGEAAQVGGDSTPAATLAALTQLSAPQARSAAVAISAQVWDEPTNRAEWMAGLSARGINFGNQWEIPIGSYQGPAVTEAEMIRAAAAGFDACRIPVRLAAWATENTAGTISSALWTALDPFVTLALKYFRRVIIGNFHYRWLDNKDVEEPETAWSAGADDHRLRNKNMAIQMCAHFKDWSQRLAIYPYNEPLYPHYDDGPYYTFLADVTAAARAQGGGNATRTIIGCTTGQGAPYKMVNIPAIADANTCMEVHPYAPFDYTHQGAWGSSLTAGTYQFGDWVRSAIEMQVRAMSLHAKLTGIPQIAGEMGVFWRNIFQINPPANAAAGRAAYYKAAREACERYGVPLFVWSWGSDFGITDSENDQSSREFLVGMRSACTGLPEPVSSGPLPRSLAYVIGASSFTTPLGNGATFDPINQEVMFPAGGASWGAHLAVCDGKPTAGVKYQLSNGGVGANSVRLSWVNDFADVAGTRGGNSPSCAPGFTREFTIPAGTSISNNARFLIEFNNDNINFGTSVIHVTERPE